jgi:Spy/CpxP family protein refolding chaperone
MRGLRELDLSEAQRTEIREIVSGERDTQAELRERSTPIREALRLAAEATPIDEALIRRHSAELAEVQADAMILQANIRSEVLAVLTPEQRAEAAELRGGRERRMEERRARRGNR